MAARFVLGVGAAIALLAAGCATPQDSTRIACQVGDPPPYFVPSNDRLALLGCARLGVGSRRVDFSADLSRIGRRTEVCLSPAYTGRGHRGIYQPAICPSGSLSRFQVRQAFQPRQAVTDYELVIWGTAPPRVGEVVARYWGHRTQAAVLPVARPLAARYGQRAFALFAVEVPLAAGCIPITIEAGDERRRVELGRVSGGSPPPEWKRRCREGIGAWALLGSNQ